MLCWVFIAQTMALMELIVTLTVMTMQKKPKKPTFLHIIEGKMGQKERTLDKTDDNLIARYIHTMAFFLISP